MPEPVAAAVYFTQVLDHAVPVGSAVAVYDLGAGTFDTTVLRRGVDGWEALANGGLAETGGLDLDAAIVDWVGAQVGVRRPEAWRELLSSPDDAQRRLRHALWADARIAKEQLSRTSSAVVPVLDVKAHLTREEFEQLARPYLRGTVELTATTVTRAGLRVEDLAGVFLVGGGSRIPVVATMLHERLGVAPTVIEQPELVVAQGSLVAVPAVSAAPAASAGPPVSAASFASAAPAASASAASFASAGPPVFAGRVVEPADRALPLTSPPRRRSWWLVAGAVAIVLVVAYAVYSGVRHHGSTGNSGSVSAGSGGTGSGGTGSGGAGSGGAGSGGAGSGSTSVSVNRTVWYGGFKVTFTTASVDASRSLLKVAVKVDNTATSDNGANAASLPVTMSYRGDSAEGVGPDDSVSGLASSSGTITFDLKHPITDLRAVTLTVGNGDELRATVPFDPATKVADLAPVPVEPVGDVHGARADARAVHPPVARSGTPRLRHAHRRQGVERPGGRAVSSTS